MNHREQNIINAKLQGLESQLDQTQEEAAELIQAISKYKRAVLAKGQKTPFTGPEAVENLLEEIVDVSIMLEQLCALVQFPMSWFDDMYNYKVQRTTDRLRE